MRNIIDAVFIVFNFFVLFACASIEDKQIVNHLSDDQRQYFTDSFENLNEDLWEPHANASDWMMKDFKSADIKVKNGPDYSVPQRMPCP